MNRKNAQFHLNRDRYDTRVCKVATVYSKTIVRIICWVLKLNEYKYITLFVCERFDRVILSYTIGKREIRRRITRTNFQTQ